MMSVVREIEDYVLDSPIALTSAYDKLVEKIPGSPPSSATILSPTCPSLSTPNRASERRKEPQVSFRLRKGV